MSVLLNGATLEGGGQILRNAISLSTLLGKTVIIENIRRGRSQPGLKNQHATGIRLAAEICSAKTTGVENGSLAVTFKPKRVTPGHYSADPVTAGSATLLLQISLPCLLFSHLKYASASTLSIRGGTNATLAPQVDYTQHVLLPFLQRHFRLEGLSLEIKRRGYFPKGGGLVECSVTPTSKPLNAFTLLDRGEIIRVGGIAHVAGLPAHIGQTMADTAKAALGQIVDGSQIEISVVREKNENTVGGGSGIVLWAETEGGGILGGSAVGNKKQKPEAVAEEAAKELMKAINAGGCVDEYLQDQIIIFMALADSTRRSSVRTGPLTLHTQTAIWVAEQMTDAKFEVEKVVDSDQCIIHCQGIGFGTPVDDKVEEVDLLQQNLNK